MKLDAKTVAALDLAGKNDVIFFDETMPGFGIRLRLTGKAGKVRRSWVVQYKRANATRRVLLGSADVLGVEAARTAAKKILGKVALGEDPQADKIERRGRDRVSLKGMIDEYLLAKEADVRERTLQGVRRYLTKDYFRSLHLLPIDAVGRKDVAAQLVRITREHSSIVAARARATLSAFFVWAMQSGLVESNPVIGTLKPKDPEARDRVLSDSELASIWRACEDDDYGRIIRLLILLASRREEIGGLCFSELDLERATWTLPANRSKNHRRHELPLMPMALGIIKSVPRMATRDPLFGERARKFTAWGHNKREIDKRSGVSDWTIHDIRRSVATRMADLGVAPHIIEAILNHVSGHRRGVAGVYNRSNYPREVRSALGMWERYIELITDGDLYAAHQAFLARDDEQDRKKANEAFHDAIAKGGGHWEDHIRTLVEGGERKILSLPTDGRMSLPQTAG